MSLADTISAALKPVVERQNRQDSIIQGLLKAVAGPASRAGVSPEEYLARSVNDPNRPALITSAGAVTFHPDAPLHRFTRPIGGKPGEFGEFLRGLYHDQASGGNRDFARRTLEKFGVKGMQNGMVMKTALAESSGTTGGYTVPPQFATNIMELAVEEEVIRPRANVVPMIGATFQYPTLDYTTVQPAGVSPFLGGIQAYWTSEAATRTESEPKFRQVELRSNELTFYAVASNTVLADSVVALEALLQKLFTKAIPWFLEYAYLNGTGTGQPFGMTKCPAFVTVTRNTSGAIKWLDLGAMLSKMVRLNPRASLIWMTQNSSIGQFYNMTDVAGRPVLQPPIRATAQEPIKGEGMQAFGTVFGHPLFITEKLPALGSTNDLCLFDLGLYLIGNRQEIEIQVSPHVLFLNNQMVWRIIYRGDGQPELNNYITLQDAATTVSPFIGLHS